MGVLDCADVAALPATERSRGAVRGMVSSGSERASNTIAAYAVDAPSGRLTPLGSVPTEPPPRGFRIDPSGRFLLAVGQTSNRMSVYAIGADGRLTKLADYPMGTNPNWVEIIDLP